MGMTDKTKIIEVLTQMAQLLELAGANTFKVRAFENGARAIESFEGDLEAAIEDGSLSKVKGVGKSLFAVVSDLVRDGKSADHADLLASVPSGLLDWLKIPGLGPKKIRKVHEALGITTLDELQKAAESQEIRALAGFGPKSETEILNAIERTKKYAERYRLPVAERVAERFVEAVRRASGTQQVEIAGSLRRKKETIGDVDVLVATTDPEAARGAFFDVDGIEATEAEGETKSRVIAEEGIGVDLRVVEPEAFGAALHYFTGSKEHNTRLRQLAKDRGWKLNEYGLWDGESRVDDGSEASIFAALELDFVPPELREDRGEVEAAGARALPELIDESMIRGVVHVHSTWSDGKGTVEEMVLAARQRGWEYLGITDHSRTAAYAGGLSIDDLKRQHDEILDVREKYPDIDLYHGVESDILPDGSLDYPDDVLDMLDFVVGSVHASFSLPRDQQTARIERALRHPALTVWGHPTGRLLLRREGYELDMEHLMQVAADEGVIVEVNASPYRLDLDWRWGNYARQLDLDIGIFPDAHRTDGYDDVRYGVGVVRKAGIEPAKIVNTLSREAFRERLQQRKSS